MKRTLLFIILLLLSLSAGAQDLRQAVRVLSDPQSITSALNCDRTVGTATLVDGSTSLELSLISEEYAVELFNMLAARPEIPFLYPQDGCYARAHAMSRILEELGIISGKVFVEGDLRVETNRSPDGYVEWWYHVAPIVMVRKNGQNVPFVFDPSIFQRPVPVAEWTGIQTRHPGGRADRTYETSRYEYTPGGQSGRTSWGQGDLDGAARTMEGYLAQQRAYTQRLARGQIVPRNPAQASQQQVPYQQLQAPRQGTPWPPAQKLQTSQQQNPKN